MLPKTFERVASPSVLFHYIVRCSSVLRPTIFRCDCAIVCVSFRELISCSQCYAVLGLASVSLVVARVHLPTFAPAVLALRVRCPTSRCSSGGGSHVPAASALLVGKPCSSVRCPSSWRHSLAEVSTRLLLAVLLLGFGLASLTAVPFFCFFVARNVT